MHDHSLNFKADLDILGIGNSFAKHTIVPAEVEYPWSNGTKRSTMKLERSWVDNEDDGKLVSFVFLVWPSGDGTDTSRTDRCGLIMLSPCT